MEERLIMCHMAAFFLGFMLDLLLGDPYWLPHPVRLIGRWIVFLDRKLHGNTGKTTESEQKFYHHKGTGTKSKKEYRRGVWLVLLVVLPVTAAAAVLQILAYRITIWPGMALETVFTYQLLAAKCLKTESMKVYAQLKKDNMEGARQAVSMIVGRDTAQLDAAGVARAAVETVAENTSDGEIAPMLYLALLGPIGGFFYKAVNTMDSMVGYKNERYQYFGRAAAKLDDAVNFLPSRLAAVLMILAAFLLGKEYSGRNAWRIFKRDRSRHASPNSAQTESVCAGALGLRLAGNAVYFGKEVQKDTIGDALREIEPEDIVRANQLLYAASFLGVGLFLLLMLGIVWILCVR